VLDPASQARLEAILHALDRVRLLRQIQTLQDALWRHAVLPPSAMAGQLPPDAVRFDVSACSTTGEGAAAAEEQDELRATDHHRRRYRRTPRKLGPRTYRTRPDPFAGVWDEVRQGLEAQPERTAKAAFQALRQRHPGQFPDAQLRTLQRRVQAWRASVLIAFDDQWLQDEMLTDHNIPVPLRAVAMAPTASVG
jgi:hypothetical protein